MKLHNSMVNKGIINCTTITIGTRLTDTAKIYINCLTIKENCISFLYGRHAELFVFYTSQNP